MREHNFMGKQRNPFKRRRAIRVRAADQFMLAVPMPDQLGIAKLLDDPARRPLRNEMIQFHRRSLYASRLDKRCPSPRYFNLSF